jgi:hypothetical protein
LKKLTTVTLLSFLSFYSCIFINAQDTINPPVKFLRNGISIYAGVAEFNLNYERNLILRRIFYTNVRMGVGFAMIAAADQQWAQGKYVNPSLVQIFGRGNSHIEIDLGFKYMYVNSISDPSFFQSFIPDLFAGYRYEKPGGELIFRVGNNFPTFINVGIGAKF